MYFSDNPSDRYYERMMVGIPNFKPRGRGVVIVGSRPIEPLVILRIQDGTATHREILTETTKAINHRRFRHRLNQYLKESEMNPIYDINDLVGAISNADMQLDKLTAVAEYAGVEDAKSITALANSLGLFTLIEGAEDNEDVGKHFVEHDPDYGVPETVVDFIEDCPVDQTDCDGECDSCPCREHCEYSEVNEK